MKYIMTSLIFFIILISPILYFLYFNRLLLQYKAYKSFKKKAHFETILNKHNPYFGTLSSDNKTIFIKRLSVILHSKSFHFFNFPENIPKEDAKVLISSCIIQLTFGFSNYKLDSFKQIRIYPADFLYHRSKKIYHKGNVSLRGIISISYKSFIDEYHLINDGQNVGLHEMAHALNFNETLNNTIHFNIKFQDFYSHWKNRYRDEFKDVEKSAKENSFFSPYALSNEEEFFAELVENFFERSYAFKLLFPKLYGYTCRFLNQDPLNKKDPKLIYLHTNPILNFSSTENKSDQSILLESKVNLKDIIDFKHILIFLISILLFFSKTQVLIWNDLIISIIGVVLFITILYFQKNNLLVTSSQLIIKNWLTVFIHSYYTFSLDQINFILIYKNNIKVFYIENESFKSKKISLPLFSHHEKKFIDTLQEKDIIIKRN